MAKKVKTPTPPRRPVQAPKVRTGKRHAPPKRRVPLWAVILGTALVTAAIVGAAAAFVFAGGGSKGTGSIASGLCKLTTAPTTAAASHTSNLNEKIKYNTFPPTNGRHFHTPAIWGFYDAAINPRRVVHNEEHGGVIIWYGPKVPAATKAKLRDFYNEDPNSMFGTLYPPLGKRIALTAWNAPTSGAPTKDGAKVLMCRGYDLDAMRKFRDDFRGKGPEAYPISQNTPGS